MSPKTIFAIAILVHCLLGSAAAAASCVYGDGQFYNLKGGGYLRTKTFYGNATIARDSCCALCQKLPKCFKFNVVDMGSDCRSSCSEEGEEPTDLGTVCTLFSKTSKLVLVKNSDDFFSQLNDDVEYAADWNNGRYGGPAEFSGFPSNTVAGKVKR
jgi:hypothetical protein